MPNLQPVPEPEDDDPVDADTNEDAGDDPGAFVGDEERDETEDGGESVAEQAEQARPVQLAIEGLRPNIDDVAGGEAPQTASAKLGAAKVTLLDGQFQKGDEVWLLVRARCGDVTFRDTYASDGETVKSTERVHVLKTLAVRRAPKDVLGILEQRTR